MQKYSINEKIKRIDIFDERWYEIIMPDGVVKNFPSVTTYLEAYPKGFGYEYWLMNTKDPYKVRNEAGQLGSNVHAIIEKTLLGETVQYKEGQLQEWERFLSWCVWWKDYNEKNKVEYTKENVETIVYSESLQCAGTIDLLALINGIPRVHDWKTGNNVEDTAFIQVTAYDQMITGQKTMPPIIVQLNPKLNKKGIREYELDENEMNGFLQDFLHTKSNWLRVNKNSKPKYLSYPSEINLEFISKNQIIKGG